MHVELVVAPMVETAVLNVLPAHSSHAAATAFQRVPRSHSQLEGPAGDEEPASARALTGHAAHSLAGYAPLYGSHMSLGHAGKKTDVAIPLTSGTPAVEASAMPADMIRGRVLKLVEPDRQLAPSQYTVVDVSHG